MCVQRKLGDNHLIVQPSFYKPKRLQPPNHASAGTTEPTIGYLYLHMMCKKA